VEGKRRRHWLREGKIGGGHAASGPMRRRWSEAHDGARRGGASQANDSSGDRGGRRVGERAEWAA
jgi:hypothetical protein